MAGSRGTWKEEASEEGDCRGAGVSVLKDTRVTRGTRDWAEKPGMWEARSWLEGNLGAWHMDGV